MLVTLKKDGFYRPKWDSKTKKSVQKKVQPNKIYRYLSHSLEIDDDVTLYDLMSIIGAKTNILNEILNTNLFKLLREMEKEPSSVPNFSRIEVQVMTTVGIHKPWTSRVIQTVGVKDDSKDFYSINFESLKNIAHLPLTLGPEKVLVIDGDLAYDIECKAWYTLFDVLDSLIVEITMFADDLEKENFLQELEAQAKDIQEHPEKGIPAEEVFEKLRKKIDDFGETETE